MELGVGMFGDIPFDESGNPGKADQKLREIISAIQFADELGLDVFAIGEHHRPDYAVASPEIVLAAAAPVTKQIKLMSAVTVLSSSEPVKVYQDFSTIHLLSAGRAEIGADRGSFIESFPLFGYDLKDYDELFEEKLNLLLKIRNETNVTWTGNLRPPMINQTVFPRSENLPIWIAAGGTPSSVLRAARLGLPLIVAIIGGNPAQFSPLLEYYREEYISYGHDPAKMQLAVHAHTFVSENQKDIDNYFHYYSRQMNRIGQSRGWPTFTHGQYEAGRSKHGAYLFGSSQEVSEKILMMKEVFGLTRFIGHIDVGAPPHDMLMNTIELMGTKVVDKVK
ncbi:MAG: LLM class flavin-dependent oxidoreductase [Saprospiraceae bacterium]|nr:LLM class flavin-dependent oxidoreductase [Saprospiraceae bacterium]MBX7179740.1 LLM class flavin-dependent oxidoreductase [Saprospiraceae bacterium]MCB0591710.1 LLM class flavin-dependent oxidoreductase [Saprospiraceae bacterium]MCO5284191.1 LLM class flavin-dependent oxidoreductase [Saprospiraceae bacterium]MCO6472017.1 LLM class flavin-dependent oxidoreductase [Saprospiraceae bacterium]